MAVDGGERVVFRSGADLELEAVIDEELPEAAVIIRPLIREGSDGLAGPCPDAHLCGVRWRLLAAQRIFLGRLCRIGHGLSPFQVARHPSKSAALSMRSR